MSLLFPILLKKIFVFFTSPIRQSKASLNFLLKIDNTIAIKNINGKKNKLYVISQIIFNLI